MRALVIEVGPAAAFAALLLSRLGCEVVSVVPVQGSVPRGQAPEPIDADLATYFDDGHQRLELDLTGTSGRTEAHSLIAAADVIVEDLGPGMLEELGLTPEQPLAGLSLVRIAPFGQDGPRAGWRASELVLQAMGGVVHTTGFVGHAPLKLPGTPAHFVAGIHAATAAMSAAYATTAGTEPPAEIQISIEEAYIHHWTRHNAQWAYSGTGTVREDPGSGRQGFPHTVETADGWLYVLALFASWEELALFLGLDEFVTVDWSNPAERRQRWPEIAPKYYGRMQSRSRFDWFAEAAEAGYTFAPIHEMLDLLSSPQAAARGSLETREAGGRQVRVPGLPFGGWPKPGGGGRK